MVLNYCQENVAKSPNLYDSHHGRDKVEQAKVRKLQIREPATSGMTVCAPSLRALINVAQQAKPTLDAWLKVQNGGSKAQLGI